MTLEEAIMEMELEGGIEITGRPRRLSKFLEALEVAIEALKEVPQYREIGTVEECRTAVEKQKPKEPTIGADIMVGRDDKGNPIWVHDYVCSECGMGIAGEYICCPYCGQAIQWNNENLGV